MKGFTTDKQLGKRDGRRYYQQKGVEGIVSASINQGMSSRVKNDAAYANTRLNNAEFGAAGSTAGAIIRSLSQKWRYLLVAFAAGKLAKDVRALMMDDTTNPWGQRSLQGTDWQKVLADKVSQYSKNPVSDYEGLQVMCKFDSTTGLKLNVATAALTNPVIVAKGATDVRVVFVSGVIDASKFDANLGSYDSALADVKVLDYYDCHIGDSMDEQFHRDDIKVTAQASNKLYVGLVVYLPYKMVNNKEYILQELCSFQMVAAEPAQTTNATGGSSHAPESGNGGGSQTGGSSEGGNMSQPEF